MAKKKKKLTEWFIFQERSSVHKHSTQTRNKFTDNACPECMRSCFHFCFFLQRVVHNKELRVNNMCSLPEQVIIKVWKWWEIEQVAIVKRVRKTDLGSRQLISQPKATKCRLYPTEEVQWQKEKNKTKQKNLAVWE